MTRLLLRTALVALTVAAFYNMFAPGGLRDTRPAHAFLGELPACGPAPGEPGRASVSLR